MYRLAYMYAYIYSLGCDTVFAVDPGKVECPTLRADEVSVGMVSRHCVLLICVGLFS